MQSLIFHTNLLQSILFSFYLTRVITDNEKLYPKNYSNGDCSADR